MAKERKKEDKSDRGAKKEQSKAPVAERSSSVTSSHSKVDKDPGSGGHGVCSSSSRTPGRASAENTSRPGDVSASPAQQRAGGPS